MAIIDPNEPLTAKVQYLARDEQHQLVKPYYLYMKYDSDLPPTNTAADDQHVPIHNARSLDISPKDMFSELGFAQLPLDCTLTREEYWNSEKVEQALYPKYESAARFLFPDAARVEVLEHAVSRDSKTEAFKILISRVQVRKRHPRWLVDDLQRYELTTNQPSDYVHIDMTASSAAKCSIKQLKIHPKEYSRFVVINLWKPIIGPVYDFPLTLCDRRSVDYASQATAMDIVTHNYANENTRIYFDEQHRWYYWHALQVDEVIAFVQADSDAGDRAGVPHTAFQDPRNSDNEQLRESIEARVFVFFD